MYIRQKQTVETIIDGEDEFVEIVIDTTDYIGNLQQHPSLLEHPESYELIDGIQPEDCCLCNYISDTIIFENK